MSEIIIKAHAAQKLSEYLPDGRVIAITDSNVVHLCDAHEKIVVEAGEEHKTLTTAENIWRALVERGAGRDCFIVGIGGGTVTDITGFVAATYMRGVRFGFVPTTLLGQVDAAIGGKNGVNLDGYKNMVGTFAQPQFVLCDPALLCTLPDREFRTGLAEVVKAAVVGNAELFELLESSDFERLRSDDTLLAEVISRAVRVKMNIVERDEREAGERRKLNLGHTFGHAIESLSRDYLHGEAVAAGMATAATMAMRAKLLSADDHSRIGHLLERFGLPLRTELPFESLLAAIRKDKKCEGGDAIRFVFPTGIGSCEVRRIGFGEMATLAAE
ncbi:MAG: 3-dehydroquinate synthase [Rikenellaceae bacterium]|nr:3-dehydroquinate synthase [Rikenellaceae bacterium]MCL2693149.1 3-dehydroquinate synthase [Rikenellaceae bacterium]